MAMIDANKAFALIGRQIKGKVSMDDFLKIADNFDEDIIKEISKKAKFEGAEGFGKYYNKRLNNKVDLNDVWKNGDPNLNKSTKKTTEKVTKKSTEKTSKNINEEELRKAASESVKEFEDIKKTTKAEPVTSTSNYNSLGDVIEKNGLEKVSTNSNDIKSIGEYTEVLNNNKSYDRIKSLHEEYQGIDKQIKDAKNPNDPKFQETIKQQKLKAQQKEDKMFKDYDVEKGDYDGLVGAMKKQNKDAEATLGQKASYYKVPEKLAVGGSTAFLVSRMFGSKGQQSNPQLYGQQTPYGY